MAGFHRILNLLCSADFGFPDFGSCIGVCMDCSHMCLNTVFGMCMRPSTVFCSYLLRTVSVFVGDQFFPLWGYDSCRGAVLVQGRCLLFNAIFFGFNSSILMREIVEL